MYSQLYRQYVLGALTLVYTLNFLDRGLIGLLLQPIKTDLHLSDTQLGLLTGIAFGLFYAALGVPIARWADRGNRVTITSIAIGLWGLTVTLCLFVTNFLQLLLARICAAIGESGCMPPTYSLIGDYFPQPSERARAMSIYWLANPLATLISFIGGGWLNERYGWRKTFFVMGIPALLVAVMIKWSVAEPRVRRTQAMAERQVSRLADVLRTLWSRHAFRHLTVGVILVFTVGLGLAPWYAAFLIRSHGMKTAELGIWLGLIGAVSATVGNLTGGYMASRWFARDEPAQMRLSAVTVATLLPCFVLFLLVPQKLLALIALGPLITAFSIFLGPTFALMQRLVPDDQRATALAVIMLLANLIGMGLGPQVVGVLSDVLRPLLGEDSLRYAMLTLSFVALWAAYHFWQAASSVKEDVAAIRRSTVMN